MIILDHEQGTEEWFAARLGKPSASNFAKLITQTGKPILDDSKEFGCSPDGIIYHNPNYMTGLEIKCPAAKTMVKYSLDPQSLGKAYYQQIQGCMLVTGAASWDAFAFHPQIPPVLVTFCRDEGFIKKLADEVTKAVNVILNQVEKLK